MKTNIHFWSYEDQYTFLIIWRPIYIFDHMKTNIHFYNMKTNIHFYHMKTNIHFWSYEDQYPFLSYEDQYTFLIISRSVLLRIRNVSDKSRRVPQNTFYVQWLFFLFFENHGVYDIVWKNIVEPARHQMTIWRMRFTCYKRTPRIRDTSCFSTATVVSGKTPHYYVYRTLPVLLCITQMKARRGVWLLS